MPDAKKEKKTAEQKEAEAEAKAETKVMDAEDAMFCGFMSMQVVDSDGIQKLSKGSALGGVMHLSRADGKVKLTSKFAVNPLYYLEIQRDAGLYLFGELWYGEQKRTPLNGIGRIVPKQCKALIDQTEKNGDSSCTCDVELPFLANSTEKMATLKIVTKEQKFVTKVVEASLELSECDWTAWKEYRLKFWKVSKAWGAGWGAGPQKDDEDEKDEKKDKDGDEKME